MINPNIFSSIVEPASSLQSLTLTGQVLSKTTGGEEITHTTAAWEVNQFNDRTRRSVVTSNSSPSSRRSRGLVQFFQFTLEVYMSTFCDFFSAPPAHEIPAVQVRHHEGHLTAEVIAPTEMWRKEKTKNHNIWTEPTLYRFKVHSVCLPSSPDSAGPICTTSHPR